jgi:hypothetical protein
MHIAPKHREGGKHPILITRIATAHRIGASGERRKILSNETAALCRDAATPPGQIGLNPAKSDQIRVKKNKNFQTNPFQNQNLPMKTAFLENPRLKTNPFYSPFHFPTPKFQNS